jgi:ribosomal protein L11 methyltransferase
MATRVRRDEPLYQLTVTLDATAEEAASRILEDTFAQWPVSFSEPESERVTLSLFLKPDQRPSRAHLTALRQQLGAVHYPTLRRGPLGVRLSRLPERNWRESWKRHFKPLEIGGRLLLRPSWSSRKAKAGQSVVVLDPGLSFGTGQHPTTSFCLQELVRAHRSTPLPSFLDVGTGSGILAIAAAKLQYQPVHGFDYDPESVRVAEANARRNRVERKIRFRREDLVELPTRSRVQYDVVCANLLADLLATQARKILNRVKPGGILVIAGILETEFEELEQAFLHWGARRLRTRTRDEWRSGAYQILT